MGAMRDMSPDCLGLVNQEAILLWLKLLDTPQVCFPSLSNLLYLCSSSLFLVAAAAELILFQKLKRPGVVIPITSDIYNPVLDRLQTVGVTWSDTIVRY
jgi:hypothetical protein